MFKDRNVEYIYENDRETLNAVRDNNELDTLLICNLWESVQYNYVYNIGDGTRLYSMPKEYDVDYIPNDIPQEFLLWSGYNMDGTILNDLKKMGYDNKLLGNTYVSVIYVCEKVE